MDTGLRDDLVYPGLEGFGAAVRVARGLPFALQAGFEFRDFLNALQEIAFQAF